MKRFTLRFQLQLLSIAGLVVIALALWIGQSHIIQQLEERIGDNTVTANDRTWNILLSHGRAMLLDQTKAMTRNKELTAALKAKDRQAVREAALPTYRRLSAGGWIDGLIVGDVGGEPLMHSSGRSIGPAAIRFLRRLAQKRKTDSDIALTGR